MEKIIKQWGISKTLQKFDLKMKLTTFFLIFSLFQTLANSYSENTKITLDLKQVSVESVLDKIESLTEFKFFVDTKKVDLNRIVSVSENNEKISNILEKIFKNTNVSFEVLDKQIILKSNGEVKTLSLNASIVKPVLEQQIEIFGTVTDSNGNPLPGATIILKGKLEGVTTDIDGKFRINASKGDILVITYIGYVTQEVTVTGENILIALSEQFNDLDEVQIIAYGSTTKRFNISSTSTVKASDIDNRQVNNFAQALQGQVAGLSVTNFSPGLGSAQQILIRGANSITSGTNPLILVDGVILNNSPGGLITDGYDAANGAGGGSNTYQQGNSPLNMINPNDIESIDILKDADATAIYGSRGTNGVILITTKQAKQGDAKFEVNISTSYKDAPGLTKRLNTKQYIKYRQDALAMGNVTNTSVINPITPNATNAPDLTLWDQNAYTDYPEMELNNPAPTYNFDASMNGGANGLNYLAAVGYNKTFDTYLFDPYQERYSGRLQLTKASDDNKFRIHFSTILGKEIQTFSQLSFSSVLGGANRNAPNFPLYDEDGNYYFGVGQSFGVGVYYNPLPNKNVENKSITSNALLTGEISYKFFEGFNAKLQVNYNKQGNNYESIYPSSAVNIQNSTKIVPEAVFTTNAFSTLNIEPLLNYTKNISKLKLTALAGLTFLDRSNDRTQVKVNNPGSDALLYSYSSGNPTTSSSLKEKYRFNSIFGRLSLDWDKKYLTNLTFRRDGSSRFGPNNKYANFGSFGLGWIFSEEEFIKNSNSFLSFGKLRGSYGSTGNDNIGDNLYLSLLQVPESSSYSYVGNAYLDPTNFPNPYIQWESTEKFDIGTELGFFDQRIALNVTWYRSTSSNLLSNLTLPSQTGFTSYIGNFDGVVQNTGLEIDLTTRNFNPTNALQWTTRINFTNNKNILKEFPNLESSPYADTYEIGRALPSSSSLNNSLEFPYHFTGINPNNGIPEYADLNGDGVVNTGDYENNAAWFGSSTPSTWGGMNNDFSYKGFSLNTFIQFSNGIFTKWNYYSSSIPMGSISNPSIDVVDNYWTQPGDSKKYPRLYTGASGDNQYITPLTQQYYYSTATLYKGYYIRLKNIQLNYTLPKNIISNLHINNLVVFISGENLAVYTPEFLGKDPEIYWSSSAGILRSFTTGLKVSF